eukprot:1294746-Amphidinium_carterae.1
MNLLEPSLVDLFKYVQGQAKEGDATASTLLEECLASLELSKEKVDPPPPLYPLVSGETQEVEDEEMAEDEEPSAKKKRGMGAGTPLPSTPPADLQSQAGSANGDTPVADASATGPSAAGSPPVPASAGAEAASEEDIQAVLAQVDAGTDWEVAARKKPGRPPRQPVMPHGSLDKFVKVTPAET